MHKKIAIIGISGSGKSTFSRTLAAKTGLPLFHMDQLFWKGNWEAIPEAEYLKAHDILIKNEAWIIEGYIDAKMAERLKMADVVIYLDYSGVRCAWHLIKRWLVHRKEGRPELSKEAKETITFKFLWLVFTRGERKDMEEAIKIGQPKNVKRFYSPRESQEFVKNNFK